MAWSNSKIFRQAVADVLGNTTAMDFDADTWKVALFNNSITPDQNVSAANSAFNAGQWANSNEVTSSSQWAAGGVALASKTVDVATSAVVMLDAADTASSAGATITNAYGALVYDDTLTTPVADQGLCYNYFGGAQTVTGGVFTVVWHANGIARFTL